MSAALSQRVCCVRDVCVVPAFCAAPRVCPWSPPARGTAPRGAFNRDLSALFHAFDACMTYRYRYPYETVSFYEIHDRLQNFIFLSGMPVICDFLYSSMSLSRNKEVPTGTGLRPSMRFER